MKMLLQLYRHSRFLRTLAQTSAISLRFLSSNPKRFRNLLIHQNKSLFLQSNSVRLFSSISTTDDIELMLPTTSVDDKPEKEENRNVHALLNLITEKLRQRGTELILADSFLENLEKSPLALLLRDGPKLKMNYIADAFALRPKFLEISVSRWETILKTFRDADISLGIVLAALVGHPKIFEVSFVIFFV